MQAVHAQAIEQQDRVAQGRALWQLGSVLGDQGQFKNAEVPLRDALAILESELGADHLDIAKACNGQSLTCPTLTKQTTVCCLKMPVNTLAQVGGFCGMKLHLVALGVCPHV